MHVSACVIGLVMRVGCEGFLFLGRNLYLGMHDNLSGMWDECFYPIVVRELCQIKDCERMRSLFSLIRLLVETIIEYHVN